MAKAQLREDFPTLPGYDRGREAAALVAEIARLFGLLQALAPWDPMRAALEAQIRPLSARHWPLVSDHRLTDAPCSTTWPKLPAEGPRRYFRTVGRPLMAGQRPRLTRVW